MTFWNYFNYSQQKKKKNQSKSIDFDMKNLIDKDKACLLDEFCSLHCKKSNFLYHDHCILQLDSKGNLADAIMTKGFLCERGSEGQEKVSVLSYLYVQQLDLKGNLNDALVWGSFFVIE